MRLRKITGVPLLFVDFSNDMIYPTSLKKLTPINSVELFEYLTSLKAYDQLIRYEDNPQYDLYPVCSDEVFLGCLVVLRKTSVSSFDEMLIEICSKIIALELVKRVSLIELSDRKNYQIFNELITSNDPVMIADKCKELLLDISKNYICAIFSFVSEHNGVIDETILRRLVFKLKEELGEKCQNIFCNKQEVILLMVAKESKQIKMLKREIEKVVEQTMERENLLLSVGMGSLYSRGENIAQSYREARKALSYQLLKGKPGVMEYGAIGVDQLFINLPYEDIAFFLKSVFYPLRQSAKNRDYYLEDTLITYIHSNCSPVQAAANLHIHVNTLHQRLKNIEKHLDLSLHNPEDLLKIKIACHLKSMYPEIAE